MAINKDHNSTQKPLMRDFWDKYRLRIYVILTAAQCGFAISVYALLWFFGLIQMSWPIFILLSFVTAAVLNAITIPLIYWQSRQFRDLVHAVVHVSGEPSSLTPPNPNHYDHRQDGFKEILQTVYEMGAIKDTRPFEQKDTTDDIVAMGVKSMSSGFAILNKKGEVIYANDHTPTRIDTKTDKKILDLFFPEDDTLEDWLAKVKKDKVHAEKQWTRVSNRLPGDKERRIFDIAASFHKDSKAETIITLFDRTEVYMPEEDDLDFISFAAHELRGPITVIRGYLDVLQDELQPKLQGDQKELMRRLIVSSNRLTSYINNILNASRYDRRHMKLHLVETKVRDIYDLISDDMELRARTQNRLLVTDIPDSLPTVAADANAVGEVLSNLIDNAIKYSNEGGLVHVTARTVPGFVEISVIDRGIGMPENVLPNLFHKFYRSHRSRETVAGTGIGLYICKAIVSSHGGTITARSIENEGTTFSFTLPIYDTVAQKIKTSNNSNESLIEHGSGWIRNHSMYRG